MLGERSEVTINFTFQIKQIFKEDKGRVCDK